MGASLRTVKRRIRSVRSTRKIMRAMELIAASRVAKAQNRMRATLPYVDAITHAVAEVASTAGPTHPWLTPRENVRNAAIIVVSSDRGLAGPYTTNIVREVEELAADLRAADTEPKLYVAGRKAITYYGYRDRPMVDTWSGFSEAPTYENVKEIAGTVLDAYVAGEVDEIYAVYTNFVSSLTQRAVQRRFLPLEMNESTSATSSSYEFEPDARTVLENLLPRYIEMRLFSVFLEAAASEHAARRRAMSTAADNASNLISDLTRQYNQARQAEITQELMEVIGAAEAFSTSGQESVDR